MNIALILAGGSSSRFDMFESKQFYNIKGKPLLFYTINSFQNSPLIDLIVVVAKEDEIEKVSTLVTNENLSKVEYIVIGGQSRKDSCFNGLKFLKSKFEPFDNILIHDGARPLLSESVIERNIETLKISNAVSTVILSTDTVAFSKKGFVIEEVPYRNYVYNVQTPQSFKLDTIYNAHLNCKDPTTINDDAQLVLNNHEDVAMVLGEKKLLKVTTKEDIAYIEANIK